MAITISNVDDSSQTRINSVIYGDPGVGKTSLAKTLEDVLVINAERGTLSLRGSGIDVWTIDGWDDVGDLFEGLAAEDTKKKYKTIFFDSLTEFNERIVEKIFKERPDEKYTIANYGDAAKDMKAFVKALRDFDPYNIVCTAHVKIDKDENNCRYFTTGLTGKFADKLPHYFDEVFYMTMMEHEGEHHRALVTGPHQKITAKDRSGKLDLFEKPDLGFVFNKILGGK